MNATVDTYREKIRQRNNLLEVPNLLAFDEQFHGLFQELRKTDGIKSFEAANCRSGEIEITIHSQHPFGVKFIRFTNLFLMISGFGFKHRLVGIKAFSATIKIYKP